MTLLDVYHTWKVLPMSSYMCYLCPQSIQKGAGGIFPNSSSTKDANSPNHIFMDEDFMLRGEIGWLAGSSCQI